jgi:Sulfotransferase domain
VKAVAAQPNFFIVGAPKCGTTALYEYLRSHPNIFMPKHKEPHYFARDLGGYSLFRTLDAYLGLFAESTDKHVRVGEASVFYLSSLVAIPLIHDFDPDAKIVAMFRNPVDLVQALHAQALYVGEETVSDFEAAWRLQDRRSQGMDLPPRCRDSFLFQFGRLACLGTQAQRLLSVFPSRQVKLILLDDFRASPRRIYDEVVEFLDLPADGRSEFPRVNPGKRARIAWLKDFMRKPPPLLRQGFQRLKRIVGPDRLRGLKGELVKLNTARESRPPLSSEFRAELVRHFRDEVALLSRLLDRDLSHWS